MSEEPKIHEKHKFAILVEDEPIHQFLTKKYLKETGFFNNVSVFSDGKEAFEELIAMHDRASKLPDIILLDLNMPVWSGWDFLDAFQSSKISGLITIVILTSSQAEEDRVQAVEYGLGDNFIVKPLSKETALTILNFLD